LEFVSFKLNQDLQTTGSGINFKFGILFRPVEWVRVGGAVHSPTYFYNMHDEFSSTLQADFISNNTNITYQYQSPLGAFDYNLTTPFKAMANVGFVILNSGLLSFEYEFLDYSEAKLRSSQHKFFEVNENIQAIYTAASNFRAGAEWKYMQFAFRGGIGYYGSPFKSNVNTLGADQVRLVYSGGIGYREEDYFIDLGYSFSQQEEFYRPYTLRNQFVEGARFERIMHNILLTFGLRF
jgi:long-subunit fatty acid transport protein